MSSNEQTVGEAARIPMMFFNSEDAWSSAKMRAKRAIFSRLTERSANLFLRGSDIISINPQIVGRHEPLTCEMIESFAGSGYGDFLIDIGANIGLISCPAGKHFNEVHMFEPNPLCCHILEVNAAVSLQPGSYEIHPVGLGEDNRTVTLNVPRHNWGGAFVKSEANSYTDDILAKKD